MEKEINKISMKLEQTSDQILRDFMKELLIFDEAVLQRFLSYVDRAEKKIDPKRIDERIHFTFQTHTGYNNTVASEDVWQLINDIENLIDSDIQFLVDEGQFTEAFDLSAAIYLQNGSYKIQDREGMVGSIATRCVKIWESILPDANPKLKKRMFTWMIKHIDKSMKNYHLPYLEPVLFRYFTEEDFLKKKLNYLDKKIEALAEKPSSSISPIRMLGNLQNHRIEILHEMQVGDEEIERYHLEIYTRCMRVQSVGISKRMKPRKR